MKDNAKAEPSDTRSKDRSDAGYTEATDQSEVPPGKPLKKQRPVVGSTRPKKGIAHVMKMPRKRTHNNYSVVERDESPQRSDTSSQEKLQALEAMRGNGSGQQRKTARLYSCASPPAVVQNKIEIR